MPSKQKATTSVSRTKRKSSDSDVKQPVLSKFFSSFSKGQSCSETSIQKSSNKLNDINVKDAIVIADDEQGLSPARKKQRLDSKDEAKSKGSNSDSSKVTDALTVGQCRVAESFSSKIRRKLQVFALECESEEKADQSVADTSENENGRVPAVATRISDDDNIVKKPDITIPGKDAKPSTSASSQCSSKQQRERNRSTLGNNGVGLEKGKKNKGPSKQLVKYTPLEQQYLELRDQYPGVLLLVECGYKYRFFGNDANVAADVLKIFAHQDHNFLTASIPVHRLHVHVCRLVAAGHKVGVVKQVETAALKAASANKNAPFTRKLTNLYTKSTLIGQDLTSCSVDDAEASDPVAMTPGYLMCICEGEPVKGQQKTPIGIVAVQPSTGDVIYDSFGDSSTRSELETRLSHIQPVEVLISKHCSLHTEKLLLGYQTVSHHDDDTLRLEKLTSDCFQFDKAFKVIGDFYRQCNTDANVLQTVINYPQVVQCCLANLIVSLTDFGLQKVLENVSSFTKFSTAKGKMYLDSCALKNLEIFSNQTDGQENSSLFSIVNHTVTRPGARMLRAWLAQPLTSHSEIWERQEAVQELMNDCHGNAKHLKTVLFRLPDLDQKLTAANHKKITPADFYSLCRALKTLQMTFPRLREDSGRCFTSALLSEIVTEVPQMLESIGDVMNSLDEQAARENQLGELFSMSSEFSAVMECHTRIREITKEIQEHRRCVRLTLKQPALEFTTVNGTEFLVEVKNSLIGLVPDDWSKISSTKAVGRFHTPFIVEKYKELQQAREQLEIESELAWTLFLEKFSYHYHGYKKALRLVAMLDCLLSLATLASQDGYVRPVLVDKEVCIEVVDGCHPVVQRLMTETQQYVPNDTHLSIAGEQVMVITGPNMGGKSCYIRQVALLSILAQIGSWVPAQSARMGILDAIFVRMGASDNIYKGRSTFMVELQETADIMSKATSRSLVILDELGRGTSTHDGVAIAHACLQYFVEEAKCLTMFVTHYPSLGEFERLYPRIVANFHMAFYVHDEKPSTSEASDTADEDVTFLYQLTRGMAGRSYGMNVARLANVPADIVTEATVRSHAMEERDLYYRQRLEAVRSLFSPDCDVKVILQRLVSSS